MKRKLLLCLILFLLLILLPLLAFKDEKSAENVVSSQPSPAFSSTDSGKERNGSQPEILPEKTFTILDRSSNELLTVPDKDFLYGAIVTEMSPDEEPEALKAQGVAAYTYYSRLRSQRESSKAYDFSADTKSWNIYVTKEQMQERWGEDFQNTYDRLTNIVNAIFGETLQYQGELICATYYAISSGRTEAASDIWGGEYNYLIPVASPGDAFAPGYQSTVMLTPDEVQNAVLAKWPQTKMGNEPAKWFTSFQRTGSGSVESLQICGQAVKGGEARTAFGLRSANFEVNYKEGKFIFRVKGYGHDVGMSQAGASYMAAHGSDYQSILNWYYPGTDLIKNK